MQPTSDPTSTRTTAQSKSAAQALALVSSLQQRFVAGLQQLGDNTNKAQSFSPVEWCRDAGRHGGGLRFETADGDLIGRGSVNVSQVHYDDKPEKKLGSATAISTIIHPKNPLAPSVHIHISWTEMKNGLGYWRLMADLNPSNENKAHTAQFSDAMRDVSLALYDAATQQGERYFFIPALGRHRGVSHFYLENHNSGDADADYALAKAVGQAAIDTYLDIFNQVLQSEKQANASEQAAQLAYHTLYFFQVLTLDRGTTTGLLVHDQNDVGIMGSLPSYVDRDLLRAWMDRMQSPQDQLLKALIAALPESSPTLIDETVKQKLAAVVRDHYTSHPEAIGMQASGDSIPPTVQNHC
ncbi:MAG: coproporphyrinogen III oxidase [Mariprofundus sp.]